MIRIRQSVYNPYYAPPLNHPLWERNVKQEICNSYHLGTTFDPRLSLAGISASKWHPAPSRRSLPCGRVFIVRVRGRQRADPGRGRGEGRQERSSSTGGSFDRGSVQKEAAMYTRRIGMLRTWGRRFMLIRNYRLGPRSVRSAALFVPH